VHDSGTLQERMDALEADVLMETIARCGWNKSLTARELGLSRVGLRAKLERYGIVPDAGKQSLQKGNS
jgi:two-component system response regulator HupR/HoxA